MADHIPADVNPTYDFLASQIDLIGSQDPIEVLAATGAKLQRIVEDHSREAMRRRSREGVWAPVEILAHLADMEWIFGFRARTILCDDAPKLEEIDQDSWIRRQRAEEHDPSELWQTFHALRGVNLHMWRRVAEQDLARTGQHVGAGITITLGTLRLIQAGHDLRHLAQIERQLAH